MAKKKKTQLKPVERGFATSSIPKKTTVVEEAKVDLPKEPQSTDDGAKASSSEHNEVPTQEVPQPGTNPFTHFLDKYQDKTDKDVTRYLKNVEIERRLSQTYDKLDLFSAHIDSTLDLLENTASHYSPLEAFSEDKAMPRLGMIYDVFRKLGIGEERILQCLTAIDVLDIDSAYEWLCRHSEEELNFERLKQHSVIKPILSSTTQFCFHTFTSTPNSINPDPVLSPSNSEATPVKTDGRSPTIDVIGLDEYDDPNVEYAHLKARMYEMEKSQTNDDRNVLRQLKSRLLVVQSDYCFREREGETLFLTKKAEIDARLLEEKLTGKSKSHRAPIKETPSKVDGHSQHQPSSDVKVASDIFEGAGLEEEDGIFGLLLDGPPELEVIEGTQVQIRDMTRPKNWTGRTAKALLLDVIKKLDRFAVLSYRILPSTRTSIAKRAAVSIRWNDSIIGEWSMEGIGGYTAEQAEEYISTVALHGLTYQQSEGFATTYTSNAASMVQANIRFIPPFFRDLWDELEVQRRDVESAENCRIWSLLHSIYEQKKVVNNPIVPKPLPTTTNSVEPHKDRLHPGGIPQLEKEVENIYHSRIKSAAYISMLEQRNQLPITSYREEILAQVDASRVVVLSGETGCGKSTQVPSFILEESLSQGKHCKIYCAEPRRISTVSLAQRVSAELGDPPASVGTTSSLVGYSIRLESNTSRTSRLIFATYGIILRMLEKRRGTKETDTPLDDVTHIIIDEVHERNLDSDFLLIVIKSLMETNQNLKLLLMSATLNAQKISEYFGNCPVITVPGRTFPVEVHFLEDAIEYTNWSVDEDSPLARRDGVSQNKKSTQGHDLLLIDDILEVDQPISLEKRYSQSTQTTIALLDERQIPYDLIIRLLERLCFEDSTLRQHSKATLVFMPGLAEIRRLHDMLSEHSLFGVEEEFRIYPLHSTITNEQQSSVFDLLPASMRKIVISTNIAETGVTIPDITCVIDTGKHREMRYDEKRQISRLIDTLITKSNAKQRRGRAGRVQPGLCFHLFTKARHENYMQEYPIPEMSRLSLSSIALQIKTLDLNLGGSIENVLSRALDPPLETNIQRAVQALIEAKALTSNQEITPMGKLLSRLPTDIRLGKVLLFAVVFGCLDPALTIAATLNSKSPFITPFGLEQLADKAHKSFQIDNSDFLTIHNAFSSWRNACSDPYYAREFCRQNFLSFQNLQQIEDLRQQFFGYLLESGFIKLPTDEMERFSKTRFGRNKTRFINIPSDLDFNSNNTSFMNAALVSGLYPKLLSIDLVQGKLRTLSNNQVTYFHPSSINMRKKLTEFPGNFLCYFTIMQSKKLYAWETGPVDNLALALLCGDCEFKVFAGSVIIDHKIKFRLTPRACIALKQLRRQFNSIINSRMRTFRLSAGHVEWYNLILSVLSRINPDEANLGLTVG